MFNMLNNIVSSALNKKTVRLLNMSSLQDRIGFALSSARINASTLARLAHVSRGTVSLWVNGPTQTIEGDNLVRAAKVLGVNTHWLATGEGVPHPGKPLGAEERRATYQITSTPPIGQLLDTLRNEVNLQPKVIIDSVAQLITAFIHESNPETRLEIIEAISRLLPEDSKPMPVERVDGPRSLPRPQSESEHVYGSGDQANQKDSDQ